jgi:hypothetical protein
MRTAMRPPSKTGPAACRVTARQIRWPRTPTRGHLWHDRLPNRTRGGHDGSLRARFSIDTGELIDGVLQAAQASQVTRWCRPNREMLYADWERAQVARHPTGRYD